MPAYVIVETDVTDPEQYEMYKAASPGAIAAGGGRFLVRGGELAILEGDWQPSRLVVLEFNDLAAVKRWYQSEVYQEAKMLREGAAHLRMVAVQGLDQRTGVTPSQDHDPAIFEGAASALLGSTMGVAIAIHRPSRIERDLSGFTVIRPVFLHQDIVTTFAQIVSRWRRANSASRLRADTPSPALRQ